MRNNGLIPDAFAVEFNNLRIENDGKIFTFEEIQNLLKSSSLPHSINYIRHYVLNGIILHPSRGEYVFPKTPIYIGAIRNAILARRSEQMSYVERYNDSKKEEQLLAEKSALEEKIAEAISLLKENGYTVLRIM